MDKYKKRKTGIRRLLSGAAVLMLLALPVTLRSQGIKDGTFGLRLDGGVSMPVGSVMENVASSNLNMMQPYGRVGIIYNFSPALRAGLDYGYTRMVREQRFSQLQTVAGVDGGVAYRKLTSHFHGPALTVEYNLAELMGSEGKLALYAGAGLGCMFDRSGDYTFSVINTKQNAKQTFGIGSHTEWSSSVDLYLPLSLTLEYAFLPEVALAAGCEYRIIPVRGQYAPEGMALARLGLVFNIGGRMLK
ncbi:MAG: hypothetical protein IKX60_06300 [Bacteroidales bacterium]|nr:hypothetical protein [Bacteroidales bacterium]